jgi:hypothetical protein
VKIDQVRVARPADQLEKIEQFYCQGIGLKKIGSFSGHGGFAGWTLIIRSSRRPKMKGESGDASSSGSN